MQLISWGKVLEKTWPQEVIIDQWLILRLKHKE
jgi:hypothetical protein